MERSEFMDAASCTRVGIVPVTWGQGIIPGFSQTVQEIVAHLGFTAYVTRDSDVAGLSEAAERGLDVIMLSDDDDFRAIHLKTGISVDNSEATGKVFAVGLDLMAKGLKGKKALVVGCGPVGRQAGLELLQLGAKLSVMDADLEKARSTARALKATIKARRQRGARSPPGAAAASLHPRCLAGKGDHRHTPCGRRYPDISTRRPAGIDPRSPEDSFRQAVARHASAGCGCHDRCRG